LKTTKPKTTTKAKQLKMRFYSAVYLVAVVAAAGSLAAEADSPIEAKDNNWIILPNKRPTFGSSLYPLRPGGMLLMTMDPNATIAAAVPSPESPVGEAAPMAATGHPQVTTAVPTERPVDMAVASERPMVDEASHSPPDGTSTAPLTAATEDSADEETTADVITSSGRPTTTWTTITPPSWLFGYSEGSLPPSWLFHLEEEASTSMASLTAATEDSADEETTADVITSSGEPTTTTTPPSFLIPEGSQPPSWLFHLEEEEASTPLPFFEVFLVESLKPVTPSGAEEIDPLRPTTEGNIEFDASGGDDDHHHQDDDQETPQQPPETVQQIESLEDVFNEIALLPLLSDGGDSTTTTKTTAVPFDERPGSTDAGQPFDSSPDSTWYDGPWYVYSTEAAPVVSIATDEESATTEINVLSNEDGLVSAPADGAPSDGQPLDAVADQPSENSEADGVAWLVTTELNLVASNDDANDALVSATADSSSADEEELSSIVTDQPAAIFPNAFSTIDWSAFEPIVTEQPSGEDATTEAILSVDEDETVPASTHAPYDEISDNLPNVEILLGWLTHGTEFTIHPIDILGTDSPVEGSITQQPLANEDNLTELPALEYGEESIIPTTDSWSEPSTEIVSPPPTTDQSVLDSTDALFDGSGQMAATLADFEIKLSQLIDDDNEIHPASRSLLSLEAEIVPTDLDEKEGNNLEEDAKVAGEQGENDEKDDKEVDGDESDPESRQYVNRPYPIRRNQYKRRPAYKPQHAQQDEPGVMYRVFQECYSWWCRLNRSLRRMGL